MDPPRVHWVTDADIVRQPDFLERAGRALAASGPRAALHLRARGLSGRRIWSLAVELKASVERAGAELWINDRLDVALSVRAHGVQLGARSVTPEVARRLVGSTCRIGASAHGPEEARSRAQSGADLIVLGAIYSTGSHPERRPIGLDALRASAQVGRPIVAIGGITPERVSDVIGAGAWGVAVRSGLWSAPKIAEAARRYLAALPTA